MRETVRIEACDVSHEAEVAGLLTRVEGRARGRELFTWRGSSQTGWCRRKQRSASAGHVAQSRGCLAPAPVDAALDLAAFVLFSSAAGLWAVRDKVATPRPIAS